MKTPPTSLAIKASFTVGQSVNLREWNSVPSSECRVTQLVTGQVRCHVTGKNPTIISRRTAPNLIFTSLTKRPHPMLSCR